MSRAGARRRPLSGPAHHGGMEAPKVPCVVVQRFRLGSDLLFPDCPLSLTPAMAAKLVALGKVRVVTHRPQPYLTRQPPKPRGDQ